MRAVANAHDKAYKALTSKISSARRVLDLATLFSQPQTLAVVSVQFLLGLGLGYVSVKALKYVLAFIAILVLGAFLSVWSLGATPLEVLQSLGGAAAMAKELAMILGLMTIGPVSLGFIVGVVLGLMRK